MRSFGRTVALRLARGAARGATPRASWLSTAPEKFTFQAETANLLNIVSNALYTEKEIFVRELLSNASDALEKARQRQVAGEVLADCEAPLEVSVTVDPKAHTIVIEDSGIGMSREELTTNLGTIALSGSKRWVEALKLKQGLGDAEDAQKIIGQFGVGFYSAFMVAKKVTVESRSGLGGDATRFASEDGVANYTLETVPDSPVKRGSKITLELKDTAYEFADVAKLKTIIKKYSNFVAFPILVDGDRANKVEAIWSRDPKEVTKKEYNDFYRFAFKDSYDEPTYTQHFRADAPLEIKALVYFPSFHTEKMGQGRLAPSFQLFSRKVLIENPCVDLAPDWLRFAKGVVDSEDIPLSISREKSQDRRLLMKLQDIVVRKVLRFLADQAKQNRAKFLEWYSEFDVFLKEGACHDPQRTQDIAKLLYFDSSKCDEAKGDTKTSLDEYVARIDANASDDKIYYLYAPSRDLADQSPYFEAFKRENRECLFVYNAIDDFVMSNIGTYNGRKIAAAETADFSKKDKDKEEKKVAAKTDDKVDDKEEKDASEAASSAAGIAEENAKVLAAWLVKTLDDRLESAKPTTRLTDSPAVVTDAESGAMRRMMSVVSQQASGEGLPPLGKQKLLLNPTHPVVKGLHLLALRARDDPDDLAANELAQVAAHQLLDNALVAAGLVDDPRTMLRRLNKLLELSLHYAPAKGATPSSSAAAATATATATTPLGAPGLAAAEPDLDNIDDDDYDSEGDAPKDATFTPREAPTPPGEKTDKPPAGTA